MPPFVMKSGKSYVGFEIEFWNSVAKALGVTAKYIEMPFPKILESVEKKKVDVGLASITITSDRAKKMDFSAGYFESGLHILTRKGSGLNFASFLSSFFTKNFGHILVAVFGLIAIVGHLFWFLERGLSLASSYIPGIFEAIWFVIVTITTVGYGDITPEGNVGRFTAALLMLVGITLFGLLTARLSSIFTVRKIQSDIQSYHDLNGKAVATKKGTVSVDLLKNVGSRVVECNTIEEAYKELNSNLVDAVVFDAPMLLYYAKENAESVQIVGKRFYENHYGIALPLKSELRKKINIHILEMKASGEYEKMYKKWFE